MITAKLDKEDLVNLVCGIEPTYEQMGKVPAGLGELRGSYDRWEWHRYRVVLLDEATLAKLYYALTGKDITA